MRWRKPGRWCLGVLALLFAANLLWVHHRLTSSPPPSPAGPALPALPAPLGPLDGRLVTALVPSYNRHHFLPRVINQISRQRLPRGLALELVIVDDSPQRVDPALLRPVPEGLAALRCPVLRVRVLRGRRYVYVPERVSVGTKRNLGLEASTGVLVVHFDDDDITSPDRLETQLAPLLAGQAEFVVPQAGWQVHIDRPDQLHPGSFAVAHGLMAYRRDALARTGCRFKDTNIGEDDLMIMCLSYSGMRGFTDRGTRDTIAVLVHASNVWNRPQQPSWSWRAPAAPAALRAALTSIDLSHEAALAQQRPDDSRSNNRGKVWTFHDEMFSDRWLWWWLLFNRLPEQGPWPNLASTNGCALAAVKQFLEPNQPGVLSAAVGPCVGVEGWYNGTHCVKCGPCRAYNQGRCELATMCCRVLRTEHWTEPSTWRMKSCTPAMHGRYPGSSWCNKPVERGFCIGNPAVGCKQSSDCPPRAGPCLMVLAQTH